VSRYTSYFSQAFFKNKISYFPPSSVSIIRSNKISLKISFFAELFSFTSRLSHTLLKEKYETTIAIIFFLNWNLLRAINCIAGSEIILVNSGKNYVDPSPRSRSYLSFINSNNYRITIISR